MRTPRIAAGEPPRPVSAGGGCCSCSWTSLCSMGSILDPGSENDRNRPVSLGISEEIQGLTQSDTPTRRYPRYLGTSAPLLPPAFGRGLSGEDRGAPSPRPPTCSGSHSGGDGTPPRTAARDLDGVQVGRDTPKARDRRYLRTHGSRGRVTDGPGSLLVPRSVAPRWPRSLGNALACWSWSWCSVGSWWWFWVGCPGVRVGVRVGWVVGLGGVRVSGGVRGVAGPPQTGGRGGGSSRHPSAPSGRSGAVVGVTRACSGWPPGRAGWTD